MIPSRFAPAALFQGCIWERWEAAGGTVLHKRIKGEERRRMN
jgi:hypothetical protein